MKEKTETKCVIIYVAIPGHQNNDMKEIEKVEISRFTNWKEKVTGNNQWKTRKVISPVIFYCYTKPLFLEHVSSLEESLAFEIL